MIQLIFLARFQGQGSEIVALVPQELVDRTVPNLGRTCCRLIVGTPRICFKPGPSIPQSAWLNSPLSGHPNVLQLFFQHPDSNLPDGRAPPRQKYGPKSKS